MARWFTTAILAGSLLTSQGYANNTETDRKLEVLEHKFQQMEKLLQHYRTQSLSDKINKGSRRLENMEADIRANSEATDVNSRQISKNSQEISINATTIILQGDETAILAAEVSALNARVATLEAQLEIPPPQPIDQPEPSEPIDPPSDSDEGPVVPRPPSEPVDPNP